MLETSTAWNLLSRGTLPKCKAQLPCLPCYSVRSPDKNKSIRQRPLVFLPCFHYRLGGRIHSQLGASENRIWIVDWILLWWEAKARYVVCALPMTIPEAVPTSRSRVRVKVVAEPARKASAEGDAVTLISTGLCFVVLILLSFNMLYCFWQTSNSWWSSERTTA
jgi:hypothetical protein